MRRYNQIITRAKSNANLRDYILIYTSQGKKRILCNNMMLLIYFSVCSEALLGPFLQNCCFATYFPHCMIRVLVPAEQRSCYFPSLLQHFRNILSADAVLHNVCKSQCHLQIPNN